MRSTVSTKKSLRSNYGCAPWLVQFGVGGLELAVVVVEHFALTTDAGVVFLPSCRAKPARFQVPAGVP